jgi:hypothetical protein
MCFLTLPLRLPFLPVQGVINLAGIIQEQAEQELHDPGEVRRKLEATAEAEETGEISEEQASEEEQAATERLIKPESPAEGDAGERGM